MARIAIVANFAYGALTGGSSGHTGGVERQTALMAHWLSARGHEVSMITWQENGAEDEVVNGVRIIKMCPHKAGLPGLRFFYPRWSSLNAALARANADVYYQNCAEYVTGQVALWCQRHGRKFVYSVASDPDVDPRFPKMKKWRERVLYRYGLTHADTIVLQTRGQQQMLRDNFGLEGRIVPMPCPGPDEAEYQAFDKTRQRKTSIGWIGRVSREKRLEWLLEMARLRPDLQFVVAGAVTDPSSTYAADMLPQMEALANVNYLGKVDRENIPGVYQGMDLLLCTSVYEGFPNTFLEACSWGVPVVTTIDPDSYLQRHQCGMEADSPQALLAAIDQLLDAQRWKNYSANARAYYVANHTEEHAMSMFEAIFLEAVQA